MKHILLILALAFALSAHAQTVICSITCPYGQVSSKCECVPPQSIYTEAPVPIQAEPSRWSFNGINVGTINILSSPPKQQVFQYTAPRPIRCKVEYAKDAASYTATVTCKWKELKQSITALERKGNK